MSAYVELQEREFAAEERGYTATKHQREVGWLLRPDCHHRGTRIVDHWVLTGSTEEGQFHQVRRSRRKAIPFAARAALCVRSRIWRRKQ